MSKEQAESPVRPSPAAGRTGPGPASAKARTALKQLTEEELGVRKQQSPFPHKRTRAHALLTRTRCEAREAAPPRPATLLTERSRDLRAGRTANPPGPAAATALATSPPQPSTLPPPPLRSRKFKTRSTCLTATAAEASTRVSSRRANRVSPTAPRRRRAPLRPESCDRAAPSQVAMRALGMSARKEDVDKLLKRAAALTLARRGAIDLSLTQWCGRRRWLRQEVRQERELPHRL